jgi:hypothetical protein
VAQSVTVIPKGGLDPDATADAIQAQWVAGRQATRKHTNKKQATEKEGD